VIARLIAKSDGYEQTAEEIYIKEKLSSVLGYLVNAYKFYGMIGSL
jgi:hypothetical protein